MKQVARPGKGKMFAPVAEAGGALKAEFKGSVKVFSPPKLIVGGGGWVQFDSPDIEGGWFQGQGGRQVAEPLLQVLNEGGRKGGKGPVIGASVWQSHHTTTRGEGTPQGREGETFFGLVVVEGGREDGIDLLNLL